MKRPQITKQKLARALVLATVQIAIEHVVHAGLRSLAVRHGWTEFGGSETGGR